MEMIGINTMASKSERATRIFILPKALVGFVRYYRSGQTLVNAGASQRVIVMSPVRSASVALGAGSYSSGIFARLTQAVRKPKAAAPITSQRFDEAKTTSSGAILKALGHERVDLGARLVEADRVDRENGIEVAADVGRGDGRGEHFWRAFDRIAVVSPRALRSRMKAKSSARSVSVQKSR